VSLADAEVGDELILVNHEHQPGDSPYRAVHAVFVRKGVEQARPAPDEVPDVLTRRVLSLRVFDGRDMMVAADLVDGTELAPALVRLLADPAAAYVHIHYAKPGCYAARRTAPRTAGKEGPPAAKGLAPFGMALVLAAGAPAFDRKPTISPRALAKPRITRDRTMAGAVPVSIACGASKKAVTN